MHRETKPETVSSLDFIIGSRWTAVRVADQGFHEYLQPDCSSAASVSAGMALSCGVDTAVWANGNQRSQDLADTFIKDAQSGIKSLYCTAGGKLFLEPHLFQSPGLRAGLFLAAAVMGAGIVDDSYLPKGGSPCCKAADSLSSLADLRGVSEFYGLDSE